MSLRSLQPKQNQCKERKLFCFFGRRKLSRRVGRVGDLVESSSASAAATAVAAASYVCSGGAPETV